MSQSKSPATLTLSPELIARIKNLNKIVEPKLSPAQIKLQALLDARSNAKNNIVTVSCETNNIIEVSNDLNTLQLNNTLTGINASGEVIEYNKEQLEFIQTASKGEDCILIGAAGTGKTTCMRGAVSTLISNGLVNPSVPMDDHKTLLPNSPGIVLVSFTRRAVSNLKRAMSEELKKNCLTIHSLLEYEPHYFEIFDSETGENKTTMRFEPTRHSENKLPSGITVCVIDESSMVSVELFNQLKAAFHSNIQFIFLGDIQQLPPVFGSAILGYKMLELKTVELVQVYRQALESPIIRLAHRILSGKGIPVEEFSEWKYANKLTLHPWKKKLTNDTALLTIAKFLTTAIENDLYNPEEDMILIPFNKACGTIELNKHIANYLARKNNILTHEIIAGFNKHYVSVGDKVLYDKEDAVITAIQANESYTGQKYQTASNTLDYWGCEQGTNHTINTIQIDADDELDSILASAISTGEDEDRIRKSSHKITLQLLDKESTVSIDSAADINNLLLSYALTVHKSQGSEWRKVFLMLHQSHNTMLQRELLYTAVTRAREELYVICEPESFIKGIQSQRIKGNTLAEKAEFFKGKIDKEGVL